MYEKVNKKTSYPLVTNIIFVLKGREASRGTTFIILIVMTN